MIVPLSQGVKFVGIETGCAGYNGKVYRMGSLSLECVALRDVKN